MSRNITELKPGDFVKVPGGAYKEIKEIHGVSPDGRLAKPSEGGFSVTTVEGHRVGMFEALAYAKKEDLQK